MGEEMDDSKIEDAASTAARQLGYEYMKENQMKIVKEFVKGSDVFGVLPTGYGKSLCYGCLPYVFDSISQSGENSIIVVVTPLTAIMDDQVKMFSSRGLSVAAINGNSSTSVKDAVIEGMFRLVLFTSELLLHKKRWRYLLQKEHYSKRLKGFIVDEAHTVKKWGETFRHSLLRIGEIRSILPANVHIMALTVTATKSLQLEVSVILGMHNLITVAVSPCRQNIMYAISTFSSVEETFRPLLLILKKERINMPRVIIYCRRHEEAADLYLFFRDGLGDLFTEPNDAPDHSGFRLVDMFTSCTDSEVKADIIAGFTKPNSPLRIVCGTIAFGLGIDCSNVREVIHIGIPDDIESYVQESGRAGRDGQPALALLLKTNKNRHANKSILQYNDNTRLCRRDLLFHDMDNYTHIDTSSPCLCCDICSISCTCGCCSTNHTAFKFL